MMMALKLLCALSWSNIVVAQVPALDPYAWTLRTSPGSKTSSPAPWAWTSIGRCPCDQASFTQVDWSSVAYGNGIFVAVASSLPAGLNGPVSNYVMTSPDGITWTSQAAAADNDWHSVTFGNGIFVAVGWVYSNPHRSSTNQVMTSPDGVTWTSHVSAGNYLWASVTYGNGIFVAVSNYNNGGQNHATGVMTSPDGATWTNRAQAADTLVYRWVSVTYGNGVFVAVSYQSNAGLGQNRVMSSPDGFTWTSQAQAADNSWTSVTYGDGKFVAVSNSGSGNRVMTSPDGTAWTSQATTASPAECSGNCDLWNSVTFGNGLFVAVASSYSNTVVGNMNRVMTSPDGFTWTSRASAADYTWGSVTYGNGIFVAVSDSNSGTMPGSVMTWAPAQSILPTQNGNGACFHGDGTVLLPSGASKRFSDLVLGDVIKTSDGQGHFAFNAVLTLPHKMNNSEVAAFLTLTTETGKMVDMTSDHFVPKCDLQEVTAGELVVGDCLNTVDGKETLIEISSTAKSGVFTAITQDNFIVVDGVVASSFSKDSNPAKPELDYKKYRLELKLKHERKLAARTSKLQKRMRGKPA